MRRLLPALISLVSSVPVSAGGIAGVHTIDGTGDVGRYTSLARLDGRPIVAYRDQDHGALKVAHATVPFPSDAAEWQVHTVDSPGDIGDATLVVAGGVAYLAYLDATSSRVKLAASTSSTPYSASDWDIQEIDDGGEAMSLAVRFRHVSLAYFVPDAGELRFAFAPVDDLSSWQYRVVDDSGAAGSDVEHALVGGFPERARIFYYDATDGDLEHATATSPFAAGPLTWDLETADSEGDVGSEIAFVDGAIYYDASNQRLKQALWNGPGNWDIAIVGENVATGAFPFGAARFGEVPRALVGFHDGGNGELRFSVKRLSGFGAGGAGPWSAGPVLTLPGKVIGTHGSLLFDSSCHFETVPGVGNVSGLVVFRNETDKTLMAASLTESVPAGSWPRHRPGSTAAPYPIALAVVDGRPAVLAQDRVANEVYYLRAASSLPVRSADWRASLYGPGPPPPVPGAIRFASGSLLEVDGRPAVVDTTDSGDLRFSHAVSVAPTGPDDWSRHAIWTPTGSLGEVDAVVIGLLPAVAVEDRTADEIRVFVATTATPTSDTDWSDMAVATGLPSISGLRIKAENGRLFVLFSDESNADLRVLEATVVPPSTSADWSDHLAVDLPFTDRATVDLAILGNRPRLLYHDGTNVAYAASSQEVPTSPDDWTSHPIASFAELASGPFLRIDAGAPAAIWGENVIVGGDARLAVATTAEPSSAGEWISTPILGAENAERSLSGVVRERRGLATVSEDGGCFQYAHEPGAGPDVFSNGFESGTTSAWSASAP